jgi:hypothetical protein
MGARMTPPRTAGHTTAQHWRQISRTPARSAPPRYLEMGGKLEFHEGPSLDANFTHKRRFRLSAVVYLMTNDDLSVVYKARRHI